MGEIAVVGATDRLTKQVASKVVERTGAATLQGFVIDCASPDATVYSDDSTAYESLPFGHDTVEHSLSEHVKGDVQTNGIESLWSMLKGDHTGPFHKLAPRDLDRYVQEFASRHNLRDEDTIDIMAAVAAGMRGKGLRYSELIADHGLPSGARSV